MKVTSLKGAKIIKPNVFEDSRGYFQESVNTANSRKHNLPLHFAQENLSFSKKGVFRGMHFQYSNWQGKMVQVISGRIIDFWIDLRIGKTTFGKVGSIELSDPHTLVYIPKFFAHGFYTLEETHFAYRCTNAYDPKGDYTLNYQEFPEIKDVVANNADLSEKDLKGLSLKKVRDLLL